MLTKVQLATPKHIPTIVISIKVHIKRIHISVSLIRDNDRRRHGTLRLSLSIRPDALDPLWVLSNIVFGGDVDVGAKSIDAVEVQR